MEKLLRLRLTGLQKCNSLLPLLFWFSCITSVFAQTKKEPVSQEQQPLELPEFIITGVEAIDVPGGSKQFPRRPARLSTAELERFTTFDHHQPGLLPMPRLPQQRLPVQEHDGFLRAEFGMFTSPTLEAGIHKTLDRFDLYVRGDAALSSGHVPNADFFQAGLSARARYIAPDKFFFFGGSKTDTYFSVRRKSWNLYGNPDAAPQRKLWDIQAGVQSIGAFEGLQFDMGVQVDYGSVVQSATTDNGIFRGHLALKSAGELHIGGKITSEIQSLSGNTLYFIQPSLSLEKKSGTFLASLELGVQLTQNSLNETAVTPMIQGQAELILSRATSLRATFKSGLTPISWLGLLRENPYLDQKAEILFPAAPVDATVQMFFQPDIHFSWTLGGSLKLYDRFPGIQPYLIWDLPESFSDITFGMWYTKALFVEVQTEFVWKPDLDNIVTINAQYIYSQERWWGNRSVLMIPELQTMLSYRRNWTQDFTTRIEGVYMGKRRSLQLVETKPEDLPSFIDVRFYAEYKLSNSFLLFVRATNLLDQQIFLWRNYIERGRFGALGITWLW